MRAPIPPLVCAVLLASVSSGAAEEEQVPATFPVLDLVFTVEDIPWTIEDLRLAESESGITIALAADVLFEAGKTELRAEAKSPLERVAEVIRDRTKGTIRISGPTEKQATSIRDRLSAAAPGRTCTVVGPGTKDRAEIVIEK